MLQDRLALSERRACRITGQHRSTQRHRPRRDRQEALRAWLRAFSRSRPRWGYRRAWAALRTEGWTVNRNRVEQLWREEGLRVPTRKHKRQRLGASTVPALRLRAERPNHVWALDFQFDETADGKLLKLLNIVDEYTREALAMRTQRRIDADATVATLDQVVAARGRAPAFIRMENGPELPAHALRDWCRSSGAGTSYIEPGSPWENPFVGSFNGRLRDELLTVEQFQHAARGPGADRRLEDGLQLAPTTQQPRLAGTCRLRATLRGHQPAGLSQRLDRRSRAGHRPRSRRCVASTSKPGC